MLLVWLAQEFPVCACIYYCCSVIIECEIINHAVLFLYPHRPMLHGIDNVGVNWILISWNRNPTPDNVSYYEVKYSYAGECNRIWRGSRIQRVDGANSSYNITGLGAYLNYSITLVAINDTGRSPPYTVFVRTRSTGMECSLFT